MLGCPADIRDYFTDLQSLDPEAVGGIIRSLVTAHQYRYLYRLVERHVRPGARILDWGCGQGHFTYYLLRRGFSVTAYSLQDPPLVFDSLSAAERDRLTFVAGRETDPVTIPLPDSAFDVAFSVGVLEHVREIGGDEVASLHELRRVLARGGSCVVYHLPNRFSHVEALPRALYGRRLRHEHLTTRFHRFLYSPDEARNLAGRAGFEVAVLRRYGFLPRNMFNRLPEALAGSSALARGVDLADGILERIAAPFVQHLYLVLRPAGSALVTPS